MSSFYMFLIWIVIAIVFVVVELFTFSFVLVFFGIGAIIAGLCAFLLNIGIGLQITVFIAVSLVALVLLRKLSLKTFSGKQIKGPEDDYHRAVIGQTATVTKDILPPAAGEVKYSGSFWKAIADTSIYADQVVEITAHNGEDSLTLKVKAL